MKDRVLRDFTETDIAKIADTFHAWQQGADYADEKGFCASATLEQIAKNDYVLTPGRYVGAADVEDDGIPFETKMKELSQALYAKMDEAEALSQQVRKNLEVLLWKVSGKK